MGAKQTIAIIGAGQAGLQASQSLRQEGHDGPIFLIGDEPHAPYQRPPLSKKYLAGEITHDRLELKPEGFFADNDITCLFGTAVREMAVRDRQITLADGKVLSFDMALLATGCRPRILAVPGGELGGVLTLRTIADVNVLRPRIAAGGRAIIIGGGYIGLEVAAVARGLGLDVTVVEALPRVMARSTSEAISRHYEAMHRSQGVRIELGVRVERLEKTAGGFAVHTDKGVYEADIVLVGVGAQANTELAETTGLAVGNGIIVDAMCRTAAPHIFAAGDCAFFPSARYGDSVRLESVQNAIDQAKAAAAAMLGNKTPYDPVPWFWSDQYDAKLQIAGLSQGADETVLRGDPGSGAFSVAYLRKGRLIALDAVNAARDYMMARRLVPTAQSVDRAALADPAIPLQELAASSTSPGKGGQLTTA